MHFSSIFRLSVVCLTAIFALVSCSGRRSKEIKVKTESSLAEQEEIFPYPVVPQLLTDETQRRFYFLEHYWDNVNFSDTLSLPSASVLMTAFYSYAEVVADTLSVPYQKACELISDMLDKAEADTFVYRKIVGFYREAYYDANSPLTNDEYYIPVLSHQTTSSLLTQSQRNKAEYELRTVSRNRPGTIAADFTYTLADGSCSRLSKLKAAYTLLLFHNPGCHACEELHSRLEESLLLSEMIQNGTLKVLAVYPDADLKEWYDYKPHVPATWINAYDRGTVIRQRELYDLKAIPMMYLLDSKKKVILKDCSFPQLENKFKGNGDGPAFL